MREGRWGFLRVFLMVIAVVVVGSVIFAASQYVMRGHADDTIAIDLEQRLLFQKGNTGHNAPHADRPAPYHYDFFALLDAPVKTQQLPEFEIEKNPVLKVKNRGVRKLTDLKLSGNYAVQVSTFNSMNDAQSMVRELHSQGYIAVIVSEYVNGKDVYRVRIDGGKQREQAEDLQVAIARKTGLKGLVVSL